MIWVRCSPALQTHFSHYVHLKIQSIVTMSLQITFLKDIFVMLNEKQILTVSAVALQSTQ